MNSSYCLNCKVFVNISPDGTCPKCNNEIYSDISITYPRPIAYLKQVKDTKYNKPKTNILRYSVLIIITFIINGLVNGKWSAGFIDLFVVFLVASLIESLIQFINNKLPDFINYNALKRKAINRKNKTNMVIDNFDSIQDTPYSLYLRPFWTTGQILIDTNVTKSSKTDSEEIKFQYLFEIEELLAEALDNISLLISIGNKDEAFGAGRVNCTDLEWIKTFQLLSTNANKIFVLPGINKGILFEIKYLLENAEMKKKVIFIIPPINKINEEAIAALKQNELLDSSINSLELGAILWFNNSDKLEQCPLPHDKEWLSNILKSFVIGEE